MRITDTLIEKFLSGRCSAEEAELVSAYFEANPETMDRWLANGWQPAAESEPVFPPDMKADVLDGVKKEIWSLPATTTSPRIGWRKLLAVAVCLALGITAAIFWSAGRSGNAEGIALKSHSFPGWLGSFIGFRHFGMETTDSNTSGKKRLIHLPDGTSVSLSSGSMIRFRRNLGQKEVLRRDVMLKGKAFFEVAKDKTRPFTVYEGNISTTALGTEFSVSQEKAGVLVKLYSGKVKIQSVSAPWEKTMILLPGDQLEYAANSNQANIKQFNLHQNPASAAATGVQDNDSTLRFSNISLPIVFDILSKRFGAPISYNRKELKGLFFSGEVLRSDSLNTILKVISEMNRLTLTGSSSSYIIHPIKSQ